MDGNTTGGPKRGAGGPTRVLAVQHAISILRCFSATATALGINEIARQVGLNKSSVSRLVATLEEAHLLDRDRVSHKVRLGPGLVAMAAPMLTDLKIVELARPLLEDLAQRTGETASYNIWDGRDAVVVEQAIGKNAVTFYSPLGLRNPAHCTASGKVLLAFTSETERQALLAAPLQRFTERTVDEPAQLAEQLDEIRRLGYAVNEGEFAADVGAVAAVVRNGQGRVLGAVAASVPMYRLDAGHRQRLVTAVREIAADLSRCFASLA